VAVKTRSIGNLVYETRVNLSALNIKISPSTIYATELNSVAFQSQVFSCCLHITAEKLQLAGWTLQTFCLYGVLLISAFFQILMHFKMGMRSETLDDEILNLLINTVVVCLLKYLML
jgi:hypothetical protein